MSGLSVAVELEPEAVGGRVLDGAPLELRLGRWRRPQVSRQEEDEERVHPTFGPQEKGKGSTPSFIHVPLPVY